jgi:hypothetical protein
MHIKGKKSDLRMTADVTLRLQNFENEDDKLKKKKVRCRYRFLSKLSFFAKTVNKCLAYIARKPLQLIL